MQQVGQRTYSNGWPRHDRTSNSLSYCSTCSFCRCSSSRSERPKDGSLVAHWHPHAWIQRETDQTTNDSAWSSDGFRFHSSIVHSSVGIFSRALLDMCTVQLVHVANMAWIPGHIYRNWQKLCPYSSWFSYKRLVFHEMAQWCSTRHVEPTEKLAYWIYCGNTCKPAEISILYDVFVLKQIWP